MPGGAHFVWIPKHSRDILVGDVAEYAKEVFSGLNVDAGRHRWRFCPTTSIRRVSARDGLAARETADVWMKPLGGACQ